MKMILPFALIFLLADCACQKKLAVNGVTLEVPSNVAGFANKQDRERFSALLKKDIEQSPYFYVDTKNKNASTLKLFFIPPAKEVEEGALLLLASVFDEKHQKELRAFAEIQIELGGINASAIDHALDRALANLYNLHKGIKPDNKDYLAKIEQSLESKVSQPELINAISAVSYTLDPAAEQPLIKLLAKTSDLAVGNAAMLALADYKSQEALPVIIDFLERKPPIIRRQGIMAVQKIGSKLALEWLFVMAHGHDDPQVRAEALLALNQLEQEI
jgi:hypothetical protein